MKFYKNTEFPKLGDDKELNYSVDVIISDSTGMLNIGFYDFNDRVWQFHSDQFNHAYTNGKLIDFVWWYAPTERLKQLLSFDNL